jgi:hypothetical protein
MERIGKEVERRLSQSGGGVGLALAELTAVWPKAVGEAVARQAWPLRMGRDGTLHVATSSSTWAFELDRLSSEIQERLTALAAGSAPTKLRFRVGPIPEPGAPAGEASKLSEKPPPASPEVTAEAVSLTSGIEDSELRELVARAARASLARARSSRRF